MRNITVEATPSKARKIAVRTGLGAAAVVAAAGAFHYADLDPSAPPENNNPAFTHNVEQGGQILINENGGQGQVAELPKPTDVPEIVVRIGSPEDPR